jgi:hypothetical protein
MTLSLVRPRSFRACLLVFTTIAPAVAAHAQWVEGQPSRRISGFVTLDGVGLPGVTISATPDGQTVTTDERGQYTVRIPYISKGWNGQVTATLDGYSFDPPSITYTQFKDHVSNQNFTAQTISLPAAPESEPESEPVFTASRRISGKVTLDGVGLPGVKISAVPDGQTVITDARGEYTVRIPYISKGWNGQVIAVHPNYTFSPSAIDFTAWKDHVKGKDFTAITGTPSEPQPEAEEPETQPGTDPQTAPDAPATTATRRVSGVVTLDGVGLAGVTISAIPDGQTVTTDARGEYTVRIPYVSKGWNGQVIASHPDYAFEPPAIDFAAWKDHVKNQNFVAIPGSTKPPTTQPGATPTPQTPAPAPVANDASALTAVGTPVTLRLEGSSTNGASLTFQVVSTPANGSLSDIQNDTPTSATVTYTPAGDFHGHDSFTFAVSDGAQLSEAATARVAVSAAVLSGRVVRREANGVETPVTGATIQFQPVSGEPITVTTADDGSYSLLVEEGWSGTASVTANPSVRFLPEQRSYENLNEPAAEQDYSFARTFVVALGGNDSNPGTIAAPLGSIQAAANAALPGDSILVRGGVYQLNGDKRYGPGVIAFPRSGEPGRPITLAGYPGELVVLRTTGSRPVFDFSTTYGNKSDGFGHYVFRNFKIDGGRYGWWIQPTAPATFDPATQPVSDLWETQLHDFLIEEVEVDGNGTVETAIYVRNGGIRNLTVRRCNFHHTIGTEGTVDIGEWKDYHVAHSVPNSGSHDLLFEDVDFHSSVHQQASGIVTQPCTFNVTFRRCRSWNNGKYGFACKSSSNFRLDRCAAWGNDSSQMYSRGFGGDSGNERAPYRSTQIITNCIFIAPADQRGGAALNWRENTDLYVYNSTIIGLRDGQYGESGGYAFLCSGDSHAIPCKAVLRNCIVVGFTNSNAVRITDTGSASYVANTRYEASHNLFWSAQQTPFRYQRFNFQLDQWQAYWAKGVEGGDDALAGPKATGADVGSMFADPGFLIASPGEAPRRRAWTDNFLDPENFMDVRVSTKSPAVGLGENLTGELPELRYDYFGRPRPANGSWTAGAIEPVK